MKLLVGKLFWKEILRRNSRLQAGIAGAFPHGKVQKLPICGFGVRGSFAGF
ncbi:MAG: hypothetical protein LM590_04350 [Thermofilum sp.]|nr:hypothetical protein [Thermofilum sp.]